jgi:NDP-sugar pyrophosphorylase family protein
MQTFLPYSNFKLSAEALDWQRLGKQRVETKQIIFALTKESYGWKNHPAVKMWAGHVDALALYGATMCEEWIGRGYNDSLLDFFATYLSDDPKMPDWLGEWAVHSSHRSNLLRKSPIFYSKFGWTDDPAMPYYWPVQNTEVIYA